MTASEDDTIDAGYIPLPRGMGSKPQPPCYSDVGQSGE